MLPTVYVLRSTWWYNHEIAKCQKTEIIHGVMLYSGPCIINVPVQCQVQITQSNSVNTDTEGTMEKGPYKRGVRIKPVEFREIIRALFSQGQSKLSIKMRCLY